MEYMLIRQCEVGEKGDLSDFGWSQARFLAQKLIDEIGFQKVRIYSKNKKASKHTAGIIASKFNVSVMPVEELDGEEYFDWLDYKIKSLNGDNLIHIFIVDIETILYFPKERLGLDKRLIRPGGGIQYHKGEFIPFDYEF